MKRMNTHLNTIVVGIRCPSAVLRISAFVLLMGAAVLPARAQQLLGQPPGDPTGTKLLAQQPPGLSADSTGTKLLAQQPPDLATDPLLAQQLPGQPPTNSTGIEVLVTPYLWMPWVSANVHPSIARLPGLPSTSGTVDAGTVISHLTWVPFMGEAEFRSGSYGIITDYIHAPFKAGIDTPNLTFGGSNEGLTLNIGTGMFMYRLFSDPNQYLDIGAGLRAWGIGGDLSLNQRLLPVPLAPVSVSKGGAWVDALAGGRYHAELGNGFGATAYGDIGGGGASLDWQAIATLDYQVQPGFDVHAGFRTMNFNQSGSLSSFNVHMYGPILAATFHFWP
jgi:hypothetical protein